MLLYIQNVTLVKKKKNQGFFLWRHNMFYKDNNEIYFAKVWKVF